MGSVDRGKDLATNDDDLVDELFSAIAEVIEASRRYAKAAIDYAMVYSNYEIGRVIVEKLQEGQVRAAYGKRVLKGLSEQLTARYGRGYSVDNLRLMRKFYRVYSKERIQETTSREFALPNASIGKIQETTSAELPARSILRAMPGGSGDADGVGLPSFCLSWSHYVVLMRIDNPDERRFYEIEAAKNGWSKKELQRQFDSALYERLALSRDKAGVMRLAQEGQVVESPLDALKDPMVLEFLQLPEETSYTESELEQRIIDHLQEFLLELGTGFTFAGRQVRISFEEDHYFIDLVFFNRLLRCFVLFDLKIGKLKHQDLGQMQMYVNYYDRKVKLEDENPTVGIVLCKDKKDSVVEMTLPENNRQIFASKYLTVLPDKEDLQRLLDETDEGDEA